MIILTLYFWLSLIVLALVLGPFLEDKSNPKARLGDWMFLGLVLLLSPVTLPMITWHKLNQVSQQRHLYISSLNRLKDRLNRLKSRMIYNVYRLQRKFEKLKCFQ
jgi:hypothetical protein